MEGAYDMTFRQLSAASKGYEMRRRDEWERSLMMVNAWTGSNLTYEKITGERQVTTKDEYLRIKERSERRGNSR